MSATSALTERGERGKERDFGILKTDQKCIFFVRCFFGSTYNIYLRGLFVFGSDHY